MEEKEIVLVFTGRPWLAVITAVMAVFPTLTFLPAVSLQTPPSSSSAVCLGRLPVLARVAALSESDGQAQPGPNLDDCQAWPDYLCRLIKSI